MFLLNTIAERLPLVKENVPLKICDDRPHVFKEFNVNSSGPAADYEFSLVAKEQVVGWSPISSYRKSTLAANSNLRMRFKESLVQDLCLLSVYIRSRFDQH